MTHRVVAHPLLGLLAQLRLLACVLLHTAAAPVPVPVPVLCAAAAATAAPVAVAMVAAGATIATVVGLGAC